MTDTNAADEEDDADEHKTTGSPTESVSSGTPGVQPTSASICTHASIIPLMLDPDTGSLYVLLAAGRQVVSWAEGSHRWTTLGGVVPDHHHTRGASGAMQPWGDVEATAAREFLEETGGCVAYFPSDDVSVTRAHWDDIAASLSAGDYLLRLDCGHEQPGIGGGEPSAPPHPQQHSTTFVVQVPWDPGVCRRFLHARKVLAALSKAVDGGKLSAQEVAVMQPATVAEKHARYTWLRHHPACVFQHTVVPAAVLSRLNTAWLPPHTESGPNDGDDRGGEHSAHAAGHHRSNLSDAPSPSRRHITVLQRVKPQWLEKTGLGLWSLHALHRALRFGGQLVSQGPGSAIQSCTPDTMQMLGLVLEQLTRLYPRLVAWNA